MEMWVQGNLFFRWEEPEPVCVLVERSGAKEMNDAGEREGITEDVQSSGNWRWHPAQSEETRELLIKRNRKL